MGIYIKGMEMPVTCASCWMWSICHLLTKEGFYDYVSIYDAVHDGDLVRLKDCPLIEVPEPHGRLIDADKIIKEMGEMRVEGEVFTTAINYVKLIVDKAEIVIETEDE